MKKIKIQAPVVTYYKSALALVNIGGILVEPARETIIERRSELIVVIRSCPGSLFDETKAHLLAAGFIVKNRETDPALN